MGTKSKGLIKRVAILTGKKDKDGKPLTRFIDVRLQSNNPCNNCPAEYNPSKMKVIKRSLRVTNEELLDKSLNEAKKGMGEKVDSVDEFLEKL